MFKARLIESFTWLFMEVEVMIMEGVGADIIENKIYSKFSDSEYYPILCYLCDVEYVEKICGDSKIDFDEIFDYLIILSQGEKVYLNEKVMKDYTENNILKLIEDTVKLIQVLRILK